MIKRLDVLIIRSFVPPFFATLLISLFVLDMQFFWLYIDDLVGKGLDTSILLELIGVVSITWVPLALPLAMLLSSIMTFGSLGETFEIVAIKSSGIPLIRFMRPLTIITLLLSLVAFLFANDIIPYAQLKLARIKYDVIVAKPAFDIKAGVFYNKIDGFVIKIGSKEKNDSIMHNIVIYERGNDLQDNIILAESGAMRITPDRQYLVFVLRNGSRYEERGTRYTKNTDYIRLSFNEYTKVFDLKSFKINKTEDSSFRFDPKMQSIKQLGVFIDSIKKANVSYLKNVDKDFHTFFPLVGMDVDGKKLSGCHEKYVRDKTMDVQLYGQAISQIMAIRSRMYFSVADYARKETMLRSHRVEWHRKFALSFACIVLFFIGAPLGSIIRKGGLGSPMVFAMSFFIFFHMLNTFGEKLAKEGVVSEFVGMWLSCICLMPVGAFLTITAMNDSELFNKDAYFKFFKKVYGYLSRLYTLKKKT